MIQHIFLTSHETYGYQRIHQQLLNQGVKSSANTVLKLMHTLGIKSHIYIVDIRVHIAHTKEMSGLKRLIF